MRRAVPLLAVVAALAVAAPASAVQLQTWPVPSRYVDAKRVSFNGDSHPHELRVNVLLPDGYDGKRRFPLLLLLHGHGDAYDSWVQPKGDVQRITSGLGAIVVMPEGDRGWYTNSWNGGKRGDPAWERYHLEELIPYLERRLRILPGRRWHAIAGLSMGGEGAMYYASQRPDYFGSAAAFSGSISIQRSTFQSGFDAANGEKSSDLWGDPTAQQFYWAGHNPTALTENLRHTRLFVAVGDGTPGLDPNEIRNNFGQVAEAELHQQAEEFVAAARGQGEDVTYVPQQGIHDWPYWRRHLSQAIGWGFFRPVAETPSDWTYRTVSQRGQMWDLAFGFASPPERVETFRRQANRLSGEGAGTVTVTTAEGCSLSTALPFARELPSGCRLRLRVHPRSVRSGRRKRFRFRTTVIRNGRRVPVRRALIRFAGRRLRTKRDGTASIRLRLRRPGLRRVTAKRRGKISASAAIRIR